MNNGKSLGRTAAVLLVSGLCLVSGYAIGTSSSMAFLACLAVVWLPIVFVAAHHRPMAFLVIWLIASPVVTNFVARPYANPFYQSRAERALNQEWRAGITGEDLQRYHGGANQSVKISDLVTVDRLALFLLLILAIRKRKVPFDRTERWMLGLSVWLLISVALFSKNPNFGLTVSSGAWILPFLAYFAGRRIFDTEDKLLSFQRALIYLGFFVIALAFYERAVYSDHLFYRVGGVFKNGNVLGLVLLTVFFSTLSLRLSQGTVGLLGRFVLWLSPVVIFLTLSRGLWVALLAGLTLFLYQGRAYLPRYVNVLLVGLLAISMAAGGIVLVGAKGTEFAENRVFNVETMLGRFVIERATISLALESPIIGIGLNNLRDEIWRITVQERRWLGLRVSHNSTLSIWAELGMIGIILLTGVYLSLLTMINRIRRPGDATPSRVWNSIAWTSILGGYILSSMFFNTLYLGMLAPILFFMYGGVIRGAYRAVSVTVPAYDPYPADFRPAPSLHPALGNARLSRSRILGWTPGSAHGSGSSK
jgi:O-antigen ligase